MRFHAVAIGTHHVDRMRGHREAERDGEALGRVGRSRDGAVTLRVAGNVLEQDRWRLLAPVDDLGERTHLELPVGAADAGELARALVAFERLAQIAMRPLVL